MKKSILILVILSSIKLIGQTSTIRGVVMDKHSGLFIPDVNIILAETPNKGTITDSVGKFILNDVPVGRVSLLFSSLGRKTEFFQNLELFSSKELVLDVFMEDEWVGLDEVVIETKNKKEVKNKHALISARNVSVEQINLFAGSLNDISRMVMNYGGVRETDDAKNDIVIRGNSSNGLLWRLNDIDIPNPNHFGAVGATGGPVSMLNTNTLSNSDFFISAFPSEYSNAISGVFDLKMRKGNLYKQEFTGQIAFNGLEFLTEGPIKEGKSSYLANYRYSFLDFISNLGVDFGTGTAIPKYQDASFNTYFEIGKKGQFTLFGLAGVSDIHFSKDVENLYTDGETFNESKTIILGSQYRHQWSDNTFSKTSLSFSSNQSEDKVLDSDIIGDNNYLGVFAKNNIQLSSYIKTKVNKSENIKAGLRAQRLGIDFKEDIKIDNSIQSASDLNEGYYAFQTNISYYKRLSKKATTVIGLSSQYFSANQKITLEPRVSLFYKLNKHNTFNAGYGFHSKLPDLYHISLYDELTNSYPNQKLDYIKSHHFVLGYNLLFDKGVTFKAEVYYQKIANATIAAESDAHRNIGYANIYSSLNTNSFSNRSSTNRVPLFLSDGGKGENYGVEFTLEKPLNNGLYFLSTLSLFESNYVAKDKKKRNTVFNGNIVSNVLFGKEWKLTNKIRLNANTKIVYADGLRTIPIDLEESISSGESVFDYSKAYESKHPYYARADFSLGLKLELKSISQEWKLEIKNITNRKNIYDTNYNQQSEEIVNQYQTGLFPVFLYRIYF